MKYTLILFSTIIFMACNTSKTSVDSKKVVIDEVEVIEREKAAEVNAEKNDRGYLIGIVNKESFTDDAYKSWFDSRYEEYTTDKEVIEQLKDEINNFKIKGFMGTWCGDSRREVPRFYKILEETGFNEDYFELISVGRNKRTPDNLQEGYNLIRVPTFIFLKNDKEVGRFVEYPRETIEKDILKIVQGKSYKHSYDKSED